MKETWVQILGQEDPLEEGMATHFSVLSQRILWTEKPGGLQSIGLQRVRPQLKRLSIACNINFIIKNSVYFITVPFNNYIPGVGEGNFIKALRTVTCLAQHLQVPLLLTEASWPCFSSLSRSNINDVGCCHLSKALRAATSLEELRWVTCPSPGPKTTLAGEGDKSKGLLEDTLHFLVLLPSPTSILHNPRPRILGDPKIGYRILIAARRI